MAHRFLAPLTAALLLLSPPALAAETSRRSVDTRDPLVLPLPAGIEMNDLFVTWQTEVHWDQSEIKLTDGTFRSRQPSHGNTSWTLGFQFLEEFGVALQAIFAEQQEGFQVFGEFRMLSADDLGVDLKIGSMSGWSRNGGWVSGLTLTAGRTIRGGATGKGVKFTPQLLTGLRRLGHVFSVAASEGDPNTPFAGVEQRRLVFDSLVVLETEYKGFFLRMGGGWETVLVTFSSQETHPSAAYHHVSGPLMIVSLGAAVSLDNL